MNHKSLFLLFSNVCFLCVGCNGKRKWDYEPLSVDSNTSDPNKMFLEVRIKRTPKGEFTYEGEINFNYDASDDVMVEASAYRSQSGRENDFQPMPWTIQKQTYTEFIENFYEEMIYSNLAGCSNMPKPKEALPWRRANYTFKDCIVEGDGLPEMAPQGYYKIILKVTGEVEWGFVAISRVTDKWLP